MRADVTGPTFTRIFDTPDNGYAERFKHVIEPTFGIQRTTLIDNYDQIVKLDGRTTTSWAVPRTSRTA